jgi:hypothetical protein
MPGTDLIIIKQSPKDDDGNLSLTKDKSVIEAAIPSWATSKIQNKLQRPSTPMAIFTQATTANLLIKACYSLLVGPKN